VSRKALVLRRRAPQWEPRNTGVVVEPLAIVVIAATVLVWFCLVFWQLRGIYFVGVALAWSVVVAAIVYAVRRATQRLDRTLIPLFQRENLPAIEQALEDAWFARLLGSRAYIGRRRGLIALMHQDYGSAEHHFEIAWRRSTPEARHDLIAPLCRIKYQLRKLRDMRELAEDWVRKDGPHSPSAWYLALGKLEGEGISNEALENLVADAGVAEEAIDQRVRQEVFEKMAARSA